MASNNLAEAVVPADRRMRDLAQVCDYYQCAESLTRVVESLFSDFAFTSVRDAMPSQSAVDLVAAAYCMRQPRYFRLFTKRGITDHTEKVDDADWPDDIAQSIQEGLEAISAFAWESLYHHSGNEGGYAFFARGRCEAHEIVMNEKVNCKAKASDAMFRRNLTDRLLPPGSERPMDRKDGITLRHMLSGIYHMERLQRTLWCPGHKIRTVGTVGPESFVFLCHRICFGYIQGICLNCTRRPKEGAWTAETLCSCTQDDAMHAKTMRFVAGDSYLVGAGDLDRHGRHGSRMMESELYGGLVGLVRVMEETERLEDLSDSEIGSIWVSFWACNATQPNA